MIDMFLGLDFATHIGCFKSNLKEFKYRFVSNSGLVLRGKITPEVCVNHCKNNSFRYAGLHSR